ncbi:sugar ABC transporter ATP-binding protein [Ponticoccus sp. SC2-23]|uniref:ATP-binding cassette domain-containing protein n=1 Tax=Alexandriicola marinus TaxID=2081710 RepID=UPI000FDBFD8C|nr:ATP-binding cassette domain-containing protein [Alexandriicola marinus]MBM1218674.1 sugar ABC transporter ATP-binding protein [Ponticoccus sp. SC6-9]MBM1224254.1 sugar ABC transporter ATP-binding protein [Ponticoccus sp. SC6-15]MBM1229967.1 sugar ABC transporter ATP-binding protein [Ponticoccus sp. SC6-38]MBM1233220.1 sugar ABC transporter ATP-binding protein [Ponticoccus sp. SC6-45]MBM1236830.1 sugar ABC transporter ATP-binding protein [Ponticoccus sp. SC6-49]MBM1242231.1 sugar ABC transp
MTQTTTPPGTPVIELRNVSKTFGEVRSLSGVDFAVYPGEIVGLLGDNGAGKSTLVKTVMGFHAPDPGGEIWFNGERIDDWSVARARDLGIETIYQERALCEKQPIWRNMFMGREPRTKWGLLDVARMRSESARLMSDHMGFTSAAVHPDNVVATMSGGEKQGVAITRALYFDANLVILDEPTVGLSLTETKKTLDFVSGIKTAGKSAIFIDHNIFHVYPVVDRLYVLDRGKVAGIYQKSEISMDDLIERLYHVARTGSLN